ncbi:MAG: ABC transporter substrate-binding protein, partial [Acidimicrobiia bacterium]|nr:ABC transporter substrate-binding protein [Acidimicrobiia bacterium]
MIGRGRLAVAAALAVSLVAASCGSSNDEVSTAQTGGSTSGASATTVEGGTTTSVSLAIASSEGGSGAITDPSKLPTNMDDWEKLWAEQRAAIVKRIKDNGWGVSADGTTLTGPEGFEVDLSKCATGWDPTEGLTDDEIRTGQTIAESGTLAYAINYPHGQRAVLNYYNEQGAFADVNGKTRKVRYIDKDDGYDPAKTVPLVDELIDSEKVFGITTGGSPHTLKVYDKLNQRCIPHLFNQTGHPAWGDPANHPWTTGLGLAYTTEAVLWGSFIEDHLDEFPDGVTVAALVMANEFGKAYDVGFRGFL